MPVRSAVPADQPKILALAAKVPASAAFSWSGPVLAAELLEAGTLVFEKDGGVRSFLCYRELPDYFEVTVLATEPGYGRLGLQTELIKYLQELAATQQKRILLEVHELNTPAKNLYGGQGFSEIHRRPKYYSDGASALILEWRK
jgi:ribosomal-protein-alanine N-acetyltransferase